MTLPIAAWLPLAAIAAGAVAASAAQATFSVKADMVAAYATVTDGDGRLVPNLTRDDFELSTDGRPHPIAIFESGLQPITIAVLLDDSPSTTHTRARTEAAAGELLRHLRPGDKACVGTFDRTVNLDPRLAQSAAELIRRLGERPKAAAGTVLWDAIGAGISAVEREGGRRAVVVLTDGEDNSSLTDVARLRERIARSGVMVYAIAIQGPGGRVSPDLRDLARATGGWFFTLRASDRLAQTFQRIADELHQQYMVGFAVTERDGRAHALSLRVKRRGLSARVRASYVAPPAGMEVVKDER